MASSLTDTILKLFLQEKSHRLKLEQLYESVKDDYPDKSPYQMRHSIRRSIQSLSCRGVVKSVKKGVYILADS